MTSVTEVTVIPTPVSIIVRPTLWVRSIWDLSTGWLFQVWTNTNISSILSPTIRQGTREYMGPNGRPTAEQNPKEPSISSPVLDIPIAARAALCSTLFHLPNTWCNSAFQKTRKCLFLILPSLLLSAIFKLIRSASLFPFFPDWFAHWLTLLPTDMWLVSMVQIQQFLALCNRTPNLLKWLTLDNLRDCFLTNFESFEINS